MFAYSHVSDVAVMLKIDIDMTLAWTKSGMIG
jgi:hypothetical protein